jgi:homoserine O-acetyltransferase
MIHDALGADSLFTDHFLTTTAAVRNAVVSTERSRPLPGLHVVLPLSVPQLRRTIRALFTNYQSDAMNTRVIQVFATFILFMFLIVVQAQEPVPNDGQQKFAALGDFTLVSGEVLHECRIGYRTFGQLNADHSNVILLPTWANGTTAQLQGNVGPGKLADSSKYFVVLVDALANGVSSSPSNSRLQPRMKFPRITIRDMVNSQYRLLTHELGIRHLKAVMGISMGGMQTFQWIVSYPDFMDKAIPIAGSPRLAPYDLVLWKTEIDAIKNDPAWNSGDYTENPAGLQLAEIGALVGKTPNRFNQETTRAQVLLTLDRDAHKPGPDANNHIRQMEAMMALDVSDVFNGSMEKAAAVVKAKVLVIVGTYDHVVTPVPAADFAKLLGAELLEFSSDCGHQTPACEEKAAAQRVADFLSR